MSFLGNIAREIVFVLLYQVLTKSDIYSTFEKQDVPFEQSLRPQALGEFAGQEDVRARLHIAIEAARGRGEALGHCLLHGPPGLGKTTLAQIIARAMGSNLVTSSGPVLDKPGDLAGILTHLKEMDVLFIDEIHRLHKNVEEYLYSAMEDFVLDLMIDAGPAAKSVQVKLNRFTLVCATTRIGLLSGPMRSRFAHAFRLEHYAPDVLMQIIVRSAKILGIAIDKPGAVMIAERARGTPRIANTLLRWVRDCAQTKGCARIDERLAQEALEMLKIDHIGLDDMDKKILEVIIDHYQGGPVGLQTLAVALSEEPHTVEEVYEPFLILKGLIKRTPRGREATARAYAHLGRTPARGSTP